MELITYRAIPKGDNKNEFVYGTIIKTGLEKRYFLIPSFSPILLEKGDINSPSYLYMITVSAIEVKKDTIGRYTGYRESAFKRNRKIYEGDIVKAKYKGQYFVGVVEVDEDDINQVNFTQYLEIIDGKAKTLPKEDRETVSFEDICCVSIIGNIHTKRVLTPKKYKEITEKEEKNEK